MHQMAGEQGVYLAAIRVGLIGQADEFANFVLSHIEIAAAFDELQPIQVRLAIGPVAADIPFRLREQADFFIVSDGLDGDAGTFRDFANLHG
jgi:hypothetical protein